MQGLSPLGAPATSVGWLNRDASNTWAQNGHSLVGCAPQHTQQFSLEQLLERELDRCELELLELVHEMVLSSGECAPLLAGGCVTLLGISVTRRQ